MQLVQWLNGQRTFPWRHAYVKLQQYLPMMDLAADKKHYNQTT